MFAICTGLTTITIENANKDKLGGYVFYKDSALTEIYYLSDVISEHMFDSCISLQNVYFKLNGSEPLVKTIKNNAFMTYIQRKLHIIVKNADEIISLK